MLKKYYYYLILLIFIPIKSAQETNQAEEEVQALIEYYNPTKERCRGAINKYESYDEIGSVEFIFSCLLKGHRKTVMLGFNELLSEDLTQEILNEIAEKYNIKEIKKIYFYDGILYTPEGERNALLLAKYFIDFEANDTGKIINLNDVLQGMLLGYSKEDIEYYYKMNFYAKSKNSRKIDYTKFSTQEKIVFDNYEKNIWPNTNGYKNYLNDYQKAINYINENEKYSIEEIKIQIEKLRSELA